MSKLENNKITTIKLRKETKDRLDHLKEFNRESYDEIMKKVLYILNTLRGSPESARSILKSIDLKLKRTQQVYSSIPETKQEKITETPEKIIQKSNQKLNSQFKRRFNILKLKQNRR